MRAGKPAPDPFLQALHAINADTNPPLSAAQCVVVEDSTLGIAAARAAGMRCVAVTTHHDASRLAAADAIIKDVTHLTAEVLQGIS